MKSNTSSDILGLLVCILCLFIGLVACFTGYLPERVIQDYHLSLSQLQDHQKQVQDYEKKYQNLLEEYKEFKLLDFAEKQGWTLSLQKLKEDLHLKIQQEKEAKSQPHIAELILRDDGKDAETITNHTTALENFRKQSLSRHTTLSEQVMETVNQLKLLKDPSAFLQKVQEDYDFLKTFLSSPLLLEVQRLSTEFPQKATVLEAEAQLLQKYALQGVFVGEKQDRFEQIQKDLNDKKFLEVLNHLQELKISKQSLSFLETQLKNHLKELDVSWDDILEDMAITESLESASFSHTLKRITVFSDGRTENQTRTENVSAQRYKMYENFLGMVVTSKPRGLFESEVRKTDPVSPPGYRYVGDSRYGKWEKNSSGQPFWVFYGQYALLRDLLWRNQYQPIHISQHKSFVTHQQSGQAFFGAQNEYGSKGSWTQNQYKSSSYLRTQGYKDTGWKSSGGAFAGKKYSPSYREQESARTSSSRRSFFGSSSSTSSSRSSGFGSGSRSFGK